MAKDNISQYSTTAASNTDVGGVNINEDCLPSSLNNAIRELMSHLADLNAGNTSLGTIKVDNLQLDLNTISSTDTNGNINITPNGTGSVVIDGLSFPQADGTADQILKTNGSGQISFTDAPSGGFTPTTTSGTSQSLDVGSYNYFDGGTLTGDTTLSFTNVPTNARWTYTANLGENDVVDLRSLGSNGSNAMTVLSGDPDSSAVNYAGTFFNTAGDKMFTLGTDEVVRRYDLDRIYDPTSATQDQTYDSTSTVGGSSAALFVKQDGSSFYIVARGATDTVYQFDMSTAFDLTTVSANGSFSVNTQTQNAYGITFKPDGTIMYISSNNPNDEILQYTLSTGWDITTASFASKRYDYTTDVVGETWGNGICLSPNGKIMWLTGRATQKIYQVDLSTAYDISTASIDDENYIQVDNFSDNDPYNVNFVKNRLYITQIGGNEVVVLYIGKPYNINLPSSVGNPQKLPFFKGSRQTFEFVTTDGGTNVKIISETYSD